MKITVKLNGGLGNRMRVLGSCIALQQQLKTDISLIWISNKALNCSFSELFSPIKGLNVKELDYVHSFNRFAINRRKRMLQKISHEHECILTDLEIRQIKTLKSDFLKLIKSFDSVFIDTCERFYADPTYIAFIKAVNPIQAQVNDRLKQIGRSFIGVHIRRGDNVASTETSSLNKFYQHIDEELEIDPHMIFYLSTDSPIDAKTLTASYPNKFWYFDVPLDRRKSNAIKYALVDLLVLSCSTKIIGSYWSSFSEEASNYQAAPLLIAD